MPTLPYLEPSKMRYWPTIAWVCFDCLRKELSIGFEEFLRAQQSLTVSMNAESLVGKPILAVNCFHLEHLIFCIGLEYFASLEVNSQPHTVVYFQGQ